jgi:hypothetical protein
MDRLLGKKVDSANNLSSVEAKEKKSIDVILGFLGASRPEVHVPDSNTFFPASKLLCHSNGHIKRFSDNLYPASRPAETLV